MQPTRLIWQEVVVLSFVAILGGLGGFAVSQRLIHTRYHVTEAGGLWVCHNPNVIGRLECLTLPSGTLLLVPQARASRESQEASR